MSLARALGYKEWMRSSLRLSVLLVVAPTAAAQVEEQQPLRDVREALDAWLASDHSDAGLLQKAVVAVLDGGTPALAEVGARAKKAAANADRLVGSGLDAVINQVTVGFMERAARTEMVFEGQYAPLRELQPFVGKLLLRLLLDTPDWYSQHDRHSLIAPLRDVYPTAPGEDVMRQLAAVAGDEDFEPEPVRKNLAFALAQWGDRSFVDARIASLVAESTAEGIDGDRRAELRYELADVHYTLREYDRAARIHVDMLRQGEAAGADLGPVHYYNAACCLARAGAHDAALDELQRAATLLANESLDPSRKLERKLFEKDPDLDAVRSSPRFATIVEKAFGPPATKADGKNKDG